MKTLFSILLSLLLTVSVSAGDFFGLHKNQIKGSGDRVTQSFDLESFERIKSYGAYDINVTVGDKQSVTVTFDDNLMELLEFDVSGKNLTIRNEGNYSSRKGCVIDITVPVFEMIKLYGSGDINVYNISNDVFEVTLSGSGDINLEGKTEELDLSISGSGDIDTRNLKSSEVYAKISGSGNISTYATESFDGRISGSGEIAVYGKPEHVSRSISGSGSIRLR